MQIENFEYLTTIFLVLFCVIGVFDGVYFHYYKYRLHEHEETRKEHIVHGVRSLIFTPLSFILFFFNSAGALLYLGLFLILVDSILEVVDILIEKEARRNIGGISPVESLCHVSATAFRFMAIVTILYTKPNHAFSLDSPLILSKEFIKPLYYTGVLFGISTLIGGIEHFRLIGSFGSFAQKLNCRLLINPANQVTQAINKIKDSFLTTRY